MNPATLQLLAKFRKLSGRQGKPFDVMQFVTDAAYARQCLALTLDTEDEELLLVGLQLQQAMGLNTPTATPPAPANASPPPAEEPPASSRNNYIGRLR
ncbi:hypothetical protein KIH07_21290 [Hydrogenophaga taeniospiralis]|uniref:hypothetical protein n=1 Tax=Hydrogenophaga taeniospiralis TaxID=65656 RepID=UPI001CFBB9ED|nr:hypothetical protein [Hydrogenophaga taeniospiralis]MCB4366278.1 hypothetical protein [Hydrogenophaga taeniospiralis]